MDRPRIKVRRRQPRRSWLVASAFRRWRTKIRIAQPKVHHIVGRDAREPLVRLPCRLTVHGHLLPGLDDDGARLPNMTKSVESTSPLFESINRTALGYRRLEVPIDANLEALRRDDVHARVLGGILDDTNSKSHGAKRISMGDGLSSRRHGTCRRFRQDIRKIPHSTSEYVGFRR
mgnify:CR=1 FL=1